MTVADVTAILDLFTHSRIEPWIDGGWAIDALIGEQTRHEDLDIAIERRCVNTAREIREKHGFADVARDDTTAWNFVLGDDAGRRVDFHVIDLDGAGSGHYGPTELEIAYPAYSLTGKGQIGGRSVRCISLQGCVQFRTGWALRPHDCEDLRALQAHFGIDLPGDYSQWCSEPE